MKKILYLDRTKSNFLLMQVILRTLPEEAELINLFEEEEIGKALRTQKFDLIISNTYGIRGELIVKNLREGNLGETNRLTPAIAYTVIAFDFEKEKCLEAGFNDYVLMPDMGREIQRKASELLK